MKKIILIFIMSFYSLTAFADFPVIELDGISVQNLSHYHYSSVGFSGNSSGAFSSGQCSIMIRGTNGGGPFGELAKALKFTETYGGQTSKEFDPIVTGYGILVMLRKSDFGMETINIETRNGYPIAFIISQFFPHEAIEVMTGPCYPPEAVTTPTK